MDERRYQSFLKPISIENQASTSIANSGRSKSNIFPQRRTATHYCEEVHAWGIHFIFFNPFQILLRGKCAACKSALCFSVGPICRPPDMQFHVMISHIREILDNCWDSGRSHLLLDNSYFERLNIPRPWKIANT